MIRIKFKTNPTLLEELPFGDLLSAIQALVHTGRRPPALKLPRVVTVGTHAVREFKKRFPTYKVADYPEEIRSIAAESLLHEVRSPGRRGAKRDLILRCDLPVWDDFQLVVADHGDWAKVVTVEYSRKSHREDGLPYCEGTGGVTALASMHDLSERLRGGAGIYRVLTGLRMFELPRSRILWGNAYSGPTGDTFLSLLDHHQVADVLILHHSRGSLREHVGRMRFAYGAAPEIALAGLTAAPEKAAARIGARVYSPNPEILARLVLASLIVRQEGKRG